MKMLEKLAKRKIFAAMTVFALWALCFLVSEVNAANYDFMSTARNIEVNQSYTDALEDGADSNWYQFTLSSSGYITLGFDHELVNSSAVYWETYIYDSQEAEIDHFTHKGSETSSESIKIGLQKGTYYVMVTRSGLYSGVSYSLRVNYTASAKWETEFNDDPATADVIAVNDTYYGNIRDGASADWFTFTVAKSGTVTLDFHHEFVNSSGCYWAVGLYDAEETKLDGFNAAGATTDYSTEARTLEAGTYYVQVDRGAQVSMADYSIKVNYSIPLAGCKATLSATSYTYNGKVRKPTVTVKNGSTKLKSGTDYTVSYKNNKKVGTATVTVKGKGLYTGSISKTFKILPKTTSISSIAAKSRGFTVKWKKQSTQTTGYQIQYSTSSKFKSAVKVTVKSTKTVKKTVSKLKAKKKYYVRIRTYRKVSGKVYYSSWSKAKSVKTKN